ncbi:zinc finger protein [Trichonephila clavipes]|nr:zinc finger protein [Trichonephila clavipes]
MATGSYMTPIYSRSQSEVLGDLHNWSMRISHKRLTIWKTTFAVLLPIYGHKCWKKSSKIGRPDWTTSEPAVAVLCQKSYLKYNATRLSFE